jgi:Trk K+ transport system NAD-binding subunit
VIAHGGQATIVEQRSERIRDPELYVLGDAADLEVLVEAGVRQATAVLITTHDDDVNIYLALYIRRLRPDVRIVGRANLDRNVSTLYRAGADDVLSYAATGAAAIWNHFSANDTLLVAEGLNLFQVDVPPSLVGTTLAKSGIRRTTGCNVVAIEQGGVVHGNPSGSMPLAPDAHLVLIADAAGEARFAEVHPPAGRIRRAISRRAERSAAS